MKTAFMIVVIVLSTAVSDVFIARGSRQIRAVCLSQENRFAVLGRNILSNLSLLGGILAAALSFLAFLIVLSWADLSLVLPATSVSYVISTLGAKLILKERISHLRWTGTFFVCVGVAVVSLP